MKILAIDTSGQVASVALMEDKKLIAEFSMNYKMTHSQTIMPMVDEVMKMVEMNMGEIDYIACASGPGSFTGLRIGAATAKGLAHGLNKPIVPVPTLEALAYNIFDTEKIICPIMDARRNQVYTCLYQWEAQQMKPLMEQMAVSIEEILDIVSQYQKETVFLGDGVAVHEEILRQNPMFLLAPVHCRLQRAGCVAAAAAEAAKQGKAIAGKDFVPFYLRLSQAEREKKEKMKAEEGTR